MRRSGDRPIPNRWQGNLCYLGGNLVIVTGA